MEIILLGRHLVPFDQHSCQHRLTEMREISWLGRDFSPNPTFQNRKIRKSGKSFAKSDFIGIFFGKSGNFFAVPFFQNQNFFSKNRKIYGNAGGENPGNAGDAGEVEKCGRHLGNAGELTAMD